MYGLEIPYDWSDPDFKNFNRVHEWKRYVMDEMQLEWPSMPDDHKKLISALLQVAADKEEWD